MDDLIKRLLASRSVWTNENGRAESKPSDLEAEAAAALSEAQAAIARLEADKAALGQAVHVMHDTAKAEIDRLTAALQTIADGRHDRPATKFARAALSPREGEG